MFELMLAAATVLAPGVRRQTFEYAVPDKTPIVISEFEPHIRKFSDNVGIGSRPTAADKKRRVEIIFF